MTLDGLQVRPATSCGGSASAGKSRVTISSDALKKKAKHKSPVAVVRTSKKAQLDFPEHLDDDDEKTSSRRDSSNSSRTRRAAPTPETSVAIQFRSANADKTLQLTKMLRSEEVKLSQQLLIASEKGHKHAAYLLMHQAIDRSRCRGMDGYSPLHYAATRGHLEVIQLLLDFGWNIDARNDLLETPLHLAAYNGHAPSAECLLDRGADVNALNSDGETPLFYAARKNHYRIARLLIRRECNLSIKNRFGDFAEDEATHEKTRVEFSVGKEDAQRLYSLQLTAASEKRSATLTLSSQESRKGDNRVVVNEHHISQMLRENILSFLDLKSLCLASQTSYRWHRAADNPSLWKRLGVSRWELLLNATVGIGSVTPMAAMSGFRLNLSGSSGNNGGTRRPSSCDQGISRITAPSIKRNSAVRIGATRGEQRPQTARQYEQP